MRTHICVFQVYTCRAIAIESVRFWTHRNLLCVNAAIAMDGSLVTRVKHVNYLCCVLDILHAILVLKVWLLELNGFYFVDSAVDDRIHPEIIEIQYSNFLCNFKLFMSLQANLDRYKQLVYNVSKSVELQLTKVTHQWTSKWISSLLFFFSNAVIAEYYSFEATSWQTTKRSLDCGVVLPKLNFSF